MNDTDPPPFRVEEQWGGSWQLMVRKDTATSAVMCMLHADATGDVQVARRVVGPENELLVLGRWCDQPRDPDNVRKFWVVAPLDQLTPYPERDSAVDVARFKGKESRMGVFELVHVAGWVDIAVDVDR